MIISILVVILFLAIDFFAPLIEGERPDYFHSAIMVFALLVALSIRAWQQRQTRTNLTALAVRLGLQIQENGTEWGIFGKTPTVEGRYRSREVRFFKYYTPRRRTLSLSLTSAFVRYLTKNRKNVPWSAVGAAAAGDNGFILECEPKPTPLRQPLVSAPITPGLQEVTIEDSDFDQAILVRTNDPVRTREILNAKIRAQFLDQPQRRLVITPTQVTIRDGEVRYVEWGPFSPKARAERIAAKLDFVCDLAERIEASRTLSSV